MSERSERPDRFDRHEVAFLWAAACLLFLIVALTFGVVAHQVVMPL